MHANLFVTDGYQERLQWSRNGKVDPRENFLKRPLKLNNTFGTFSPVDFSDGKLIKADFILKCCTHRIGYHIGDFVSGPDNASVLASREQISIRAVGGVRNAEVIAAGSRGTMLINDTEDSRIRVLGRRFRIAMPVPYLYFLYVGASHNVRWTTLEYNTDIVLDQYPELRTALG